MKLRRMGGMGRMERMERMDLSMVFEFDNKYSKDLKFKMI